VTADSFNPAFRPHHPLPQEIYLEEILGERIAAKMIESDAEPVALTVPDGCDSVELCYGPIEVNPDIGREHDLDLVITVGRARMSSPANIDGESLGPLEPGSTVLVTVPWRAASWVELAAGRLQVTVVARFFRAVASSPLA
jgi:hypothetical protein